MPFHRVAVLGSTLPRTKLLPFLREVAERNRGVLDYAKEFLT